MKHTFVAGLFVFMLMNSFSFLHSGETVRSKEWIPEIVDSTRYVYFMSMMWDNTRSWKIETKNNFKDENNTVKSVTIHITGIHRKTDGYLNFLRSKESSSMNATFYVRYQDAGSIADRFKIYWGEKKFYQPVYYNFTILKDGHFRVLKYRYDSKPNWVCIQDGFATNWNPAKKFNVICIQQRVNECKISVNGGILMYTWQESFEGLDTGFDIDINDSWDISKIEYAE